MSSGLASSCWHIDAGDYNHLARFLQLISVTVAAAAGESFHVATSADRFFHVPAAAGVTGGELFHVATVAPDKLFLQLLIQLHLRQRPAHLHSLPVHALLQHHTITGHFPGH